MPALTPMLGEIMAGPLCIRQQRSTNILRWRVIEVLLSAAADLNARDDDGSAPLHEAAQHNANPAVVSVLLKAGADPNTRTDTGWTPLHEIAALPSADPALAEIIRALLAAGAGLDARTDEGSSPLHLAARHSASSAVVGTLLDAGADGKAQDHRGDTPWDYVQTNLALKGTDTWWRLNDVRF